MLILKKEIKKKSQYDPAGAGVGAACLKMNRRPTGVRKCAPRRNVVRRMVAYVLHCTVLYSTVEILYSGWKLRITIESGYGYDHEREGCNNFSVSAVRGGREANIGGNKRKSVNCLRGVTNRLVVGRRLSSSDVSVTRMNEVLTRRFENEVLNY